MSQPAPNSAVAAPVAQRVGDLDWPVLAQALDGEGIALTDQLISVTERRALIDLYSDASLFRSTIDMARHRFGQGQYRYFDHPLPEIVVALRTAFWPRLLPIARVWAQRRNQVAPWPDDLAEWLAMCHQAGQQRPTPLLLRYGPGDWNALHRDVSGSWCFLCNLSSASMTPMWTTRAASL